MRIFKIVTGCFLITVITPLVAWGQTAAFDPKDLNGKYHRESEFQTYSNVPGGANELQAFLLGQAKAPRKLNVPTEEAPFTAAGQAAFDKNIPSYGRRIAQPKLGNDPQGMCDPLACRAC